MVRKTRMMPMAQPPIRFDNGAAYDRGMGVWSQLAGQVFLDWLAPPTGLRWIDIGCGSGAFTELLAQRSAPVKIQGIDPFEEQLAFARTRPALREATFREGESSLATIQRARRHGSIRSKRCVTSDPCQPCRVWVRRCSVWCSCWGHQPGASSLPTRRWRSAASL